MTLTIESMPSPNYSSRCGHAPRATVIHYTGAGSAKGSALWFMMAESRVSAHYVIARQGHVIQCVDLDQAAWHCGVAELVIDGEAYSAANELTIGIELANFGRLHWDGEEFCYALGEDHIPYPGLQPTKASLEYDNGLVVSGHWDPYPDVQIDALQALLRRLAATYPEAVQNLVGHEEIAMPLGRKIDPGPLFPWDRFFRRTVRRTRRI
jgi:N-acetylmuramoyl-L-alanine amidase